MLATCAQQHYLGAFASKGWEGAHWAAVQRQQQGTNAYKYPKNRGLSRRTAPILQGSGLLQRQAGAIAGSVQLTRNNSGLK